MTTINPKLALHVIAPLVAFYGLRALGVPAFVALLAGAGVSAAVALHSVATQRRFGGMQVFVLATMALTVLFALVSGNARLMLVRNGWGPFLLTTGAIAFPSTPPSAPAWPSPCRSTSSPPWTTSSSPSPSPRSCSSNASTADPSCAGTTGVYTE